MCEFAVGDRVVVANNRYPQDMNDYYGHVVGVNHELFMARVEIEGRGNGKSFGLHALMCNPWPFYCEELRHID